MTSLAQLVAQGALEFGDGYRTKQTELAFSGFRILRAGDVDELGVHLDGPDFVDAHFGAAIGRKRVLVGDVVLTTKGTVGRRAFVRSIPEPSVYSPQLCYFRLDPSHVDPCFFYYWLGAPEFVRQLDALKGSTDMAPYVSLSQLRGVTIQLPVLTEQRAIAEVLGALDDKIAANVRLTATCEELMVALVSGVRDTTPLACLVELSRDSVSTDKMNGRHVWHYSLPAFDAGALPVDELGDSIQSNKLAIRRPSVLLSKLNPRTPRVWDVPSPEHGAAASTEFLVLEPLSISTSLLWALLMRRSSQSYMCEHVAGTTGSHQRVRPEEALGLPVPSPDHIAEDVRNQVAILGLRAVAARRESRTLASLRDTLLPGLMDGSIRVKDAAARVAD